MTIASRILTFVLLLALMACSDDNEKPAKPGEAEFARMLNRARLEAWRDDEEGRAEARRLLEACLEHAPEDGEALLELARVLIATPESEAALPIVARARAALPEDRLFARASLDYVEGLAHKKADRWAEACAPLQAALAARPEIAQLRYQCAWALENAGRGQEARALYEELVARKELLRPASYRLMVLARQRRDETSEVAARALFEVQDPDDKPEVEFCELLRVNRRRRVLPREKDDPAPIRFARREAAADELGLHADVDGDGQPERLDGERLLALGLLDLVVVDFDHDGDLDFVGLDLDRSLAARVNDGKGGFQPRVLLDSSNLAWKTRMESGIVGQRIAFADFDGDNDVDFVVASEVGITLALNERLDGFRAARGVAGGPWNCVATGDVNGDGHPDIIAAGPRGIFLIEVRDDGPTLGEPISLAEGVVATALLADDLDDDGDLDLLASGLADVLMIRNRRDRGHASAAVTETGDLTAGTLLRRGDEILVGPDLRQTSFTATGAFVLEPAVPEGNRALMIQLEGRRDNHLGVGAVIELDAGELQITRMKKAAAAIRIGYGRHELDGIAIRWPNGIRQSVLAADIPADGIITIKQKQGLVASCPFLYTRSESGWRFLTDVVGIAPLDEWLPPGAAPYLDPHEFVRIPGEALAVEEGRATISITEELRETTYLDGLELLFVDHDPGEALLLDESTRAEVRENLVLLRVPQGSGRTIGLRRPSGERLDEIVARRDGRFADNGAPPRSQWAGYVEGGDLLLEVPEGAAALSFEGRVAWYDSTVAYALHQAGLGFDFLPRLRDLRDDSIIDLGLFRGIDRGLVVELPEGARSLRLESRHALLFDRISALPRPETLDFGVAEAGREVGGLVLRRAELVSARLFERGYSAITGEVATHRQSYDYQQIERDMGFPRPKGRATATGDVRELIASEDDALAVLLPADAVEIDFSLPPVPTGKRRTYFLRVVGWAKEAGFHNRSGMQIEPLPFHDMSAYPPPAGETSAQISPRDRRSR